jgi:hypothetical protein
VNCCSAAEAKGFAPEPHPFGAGWPEVAYEAETIFAGEFEPHETGDQRYFVVAYNAEGNEVGQRRVRGFVQ